MSSFIYLISKLLPAYVYIAGGYVARRWLGLSQSFIGKVLFYVLVPLVVFKGALLSQVGPFMTLVFLSFILSSCMALLAHVMVPTFREQLRPGMLKCVYGYFNIGWFGIPIVHALYGQSGTLIMTALYVGGMLFGNSVGYLMIVRDGGRQGSIIRQVLGMPSLFAMITGFALRQTPWYDAIAQTAFVSEILDLGLQLTSVLGMGLVGMSVASVKIKHIHWRKLMWLLLTRSVCALIVVLGLSSIFWGMGWINNEQRKIFLLLPLLPIAANILVFTSHTNENARAENTFLGIALLASTIASCVLFLLFFVAVALS